MEGWGKMKSGDVGISAEVKVCPWLVREKVVVRWGISQLGSLEVDQFRVTEG